MYPANASHKDEILMKHRLQFADSFKDLKDLRKQLYSAAENLESSYNKVDNCKQFVLESSKDYAAKALVSTVDHLGSVADKLNKLIDEKANEFSATYVRFSSIQQRLATFEGLIHFSERHLPRIEAMGHHKHTIIPAEIISDVQQPKQDNYFSKGFQVANMKPNQALVVRKEKSRDASPNPPSFSFTNVVVPKKEEGRRSVSPFRFPLNLSATSTKTSVSPSLSVQKRRWASEEPRKAISACRRRHDEMTKRERDMESSYSKTSNHLFKALLSLHKPR